MRIAYLDPVNENYKFEGIVDVLKKYINKGTEIDFKFLERGAGNLEYQCYEAYTVPELIYEVKKLKAEKYDAVIIGCFFDPGIDAIREFIDDMVIVGPGESSMLLGRYLGNKFSIIAGRKKHLARMYEVVDRVGLSSKLSSIRTLDIRVDDMQKDHEFLLKRTSDEISKAISEDNAEVIILGCTMEAGQFEKLQKTFNVPVIDPSVAALKTAEYLVSCKNMCGWDISRALSYETPDIFEMKTYNIFDKLL